MITVLLLLCMFYHVEAFAPVKSIQRRQSSTSLHMGGNKAKFGIFSPAVYIAKFALGEAKLNKVIFIVKPNSGTRLLLRLILSIDSRKSNFFAQSSNYRMVFTIWRIQS
jgi:hypothetical protein